VNGLVDASEKQSAASRSLLRNDITAIYYRYLDTESLPAYEKENLVELYSSYTELKGNHYIEQIFKDMMGWDVVKKVRG
jgi:predicted cupin superfamily sugar epimerase